MEYYLHFVSISLILFAEFFYPHVKFEMSPITYQSNTSQMSDISKDKTGYNGVDDNWSRFMSFVGC